jgi:excisionase family DNA binding protein
MPRGIPVAGRNGADMAETQERLQSVEEVSKRLSVSTFTTRRLIKAKQLRAVRVGKRVLVPQSEIERVITEGCGKHAGKS